MEWFCTEEARSVLQRREKRLTAVFWSLAGITAAAFIILCLLVRTRDAQVMHWVLMAVAAVPGCLCILLWLPGVQEARTRLAHLDLLREGEKTIREGRLTLTREVVRIPKSILIRKVLLDTGKEDPERLNLDEGWVTRMPPDGSLILLVLKSNQTLMAY